MFKKYSFLWLVLFFFSLASGLSAESAAHIIKNHLMDEIFRRSPSFKGATIDVQFKNPSQAAELEKILVADKLADFKLKLPGNSRLVGSQIIPLQVLSNGQELNFNLYLNISVLKKAVHSAVNIKKFSTITPGLLALKEINLAEVPRDIFFDPTEILGREAAFFIPRDRVLTSWMVRQPPVIKKDSLITLEVRTETLFIKLEVQALTDGYVGQKIMVLNPVSRKKILAKIIDAETVIFN